MLSWSMVAYAVWDAQFRAPAEVLIQSQTYEKAVALVSGRELPGYCRVLWEQQDVFLRAAYPLTKPSTDFAADLVAWKNGSVIRGVPSGEARVHLPPETLFDRRRRVLGGLCCFLGGR
jgi:hypothetical protein